MRSSSLGRLSLPIQASPSLCLLLMSLCFLLSLYRLNTRRRGSILLQAAVRFVWNCHVDEARVQERLDELSAELGAVLSSDRRHKFTQSSFFAAELKNNHLVPTWSRLGPGLRLMLTGGQPH